MSAAVLDGGSGPRLRRLGCAMGELTRADGSALLAQGETVVACAVFGPGDVRPNKELLSQATVEVTYKPKLGLARVADKAREVQIQSCCQAAILTSLHPRTLVSSALCSHCGNL